MAGNLDQKLGPRRCASFTSRSLVKLPIFSLSQPSEGLQIPPPSRSPLALRLVTCQLHEMLHVAEGTAITKFTSRTILLDDRFWLSVSQGKCPYPYTTYVGITWLQYAITCRIRTRLGQFLCYLTTGSQYCPAIPCSPIIKTDDLILDPWWLPHWGTAFGVGNLFRGHRSTRVVLEAPCRGTPLTFAYGKLMLFLRNWWTTKQHNKLHGSPGRWTPIGYASHFGYTSVRSSTLLAFCCGRTRRRRDG